MKSYLTLLCAVFLGLSLFTRAYARIKVSPFPPFVESHSTIADLELGASDLSILVPLQSSIEESTEDSQFGKLGTGMCNAPTLDLGADDPIISEQVWQDWAKDSLLSILPLPNEERIWVKNTANLSVAQRKKKLLEEMRALPNVDSDDLCPDPIGINDLITDDVDSLRNAGTHVSATQTLPAGACRYKNWHVVGARFEPCGFRAKVLRDNPKAFDPGVQKAFPKDACGGSELRLVIQPFIPRADGGFRSIDMAIHAFYKLEDVNSLVTDLRTLRHLTRRALAGKQGEGSHAVWYADTKDMLIPHPGLREEMDCSAGNSLGIGSVGQEWRRILSRYAKQSRLFKLTWMTSDNSGSNWSFGLRIVQPEEGTLAPRSLVRQEPFKVETFTLSQLARGYPFTPFDMTMNTVDYFYRDGRADKALTTPIARAASKELMDIANPDRTGLNLGGKLGATCASCHTRDQTERAVRLRTGKTHDQLAALADTPVLTYPIWDPIVKSIEKRNDNNLRNFGYGPAMTISVSRRAANESELLRLLVKDYFPPSTGPESLVFRQDSQAQNVHLAIPEPISFKSDIAPLLEAHCGYCHTTKRVPTLGIEQIAQVWSGAIVANICSELGAWQHMPPGKDIPSHDKDLIVAWAQSLNPTIEPIGCRDLQSPLR